MFTYFLLWIVACYLKIKQWYSIPDTLNFENNFAVIKYFYKGKECYYYVPIENHDEFMYQNRPITLHMANNNIVKVSPFVPIYPLTNSSSNFYSTHNEQEENVQFIDHQDYVIHLQEELNDLEEVEEDNMVEDILNSKSAEEENSEENSKNVDSPDIVNQLINLINDTLIKPQNDKQPNSLITGFNKFLTTLTKDCNKEHELVDLCNDYITYYVSQDSETDPKLVEKWEKEIITQLSNISNYQTLLKYNNLFSPLKGSQYQAILDILAKKMLELNSNGPNEPNEYIVNVKSILTNLNLGEKINNKITGLLDYYIIIEKYKAYLSILNPNEQEKQECDNLQKQLLTHFKEVGTTEEILTYKFNFMMYFKIFNVKIENEGYQELLSLLNQLEQEYLNKNKA